MNFKSAAIVLALLAGPTAAESVAEAGDVVVWHAYRGQERAALEKVVKQFSAPGVTIKLLPIPYDAYADKITAAIPRGKGPDLFIFAQDRLGDWAEAEVVEPVDFWLTDELRAAFVPKTLEALTWDDAVYGLPMAFKTTALFYVKRKIKKAPTSTDALIKAAKKHTKKGSYGLAYPNADFYYHAAWLHGFGGRVFDKNGRPQLASKEAVAAMQFAQDLAHNQGILPEEMTTTLTTSLFNRGKAAFVISGPWFVGEIDKKVKYGVAPLPTLPNGKPAQPFLSVEGVMLSAKSKNKKEAFVVAQHLVSAKSGRIMALEGGQPTAQASVYKDAKVKKHPHLSVFRAQLDNSVPMPNSPAMRKVWTPIDRAMKRAIRSKEDAKTALSAAQAEVEKLARSR